MKLEIVEIPDLCKIQNWNNNSALLISSSHCSCPPLSMSIYARYSLILEFIAKSPPCLTQENDLYTIVVQYDKCVHQHHKC